MWRLSRVDVVLTVRVRRVLIGTWLLQLKERKRIGERW